jgi:hypothetical protein
MLELDRARRRVCFELNLPDVFISRTTQSKPFINVKRFRFSEVRQHLGILIVVGSCMNDELFA